MSLAGALHPILVLMDSFCPAAFERDGLGALPPTPPSPVMGAATPPGSLRVSDSPRMSTPGSPRFRPRSARDRRPSIWESADDEDEEEGAGGGRGSRAATAAADADGGGDGGWDDWDEEEDEGTESELVVECHRYANCLAASASSSGDAAGLIARLGAEGDSLTAREHTVLQWLCNEAT